MLKKISFILLMLTLPSVYADDSNKKVEQEKSISEQYDLGTTYYRGKIFSNDVDGSKALQWWLLSAEQGNPEAQYNVGYIYIEGRYATQDYQQVLKWWLLSAEQGFPEAQYNLAVMYEDGVVIPQDYKEAVKWLKKASEQGHAKSQSMLALMYFKGEHVDQDYQETFNLNLKSAKQGDALACYNLGVMYNSGKFVEKDRILAHMYFNLAATGGDSDAVTARDSVEERITKSDLKKAQDLAINWHNNYN